MGVVTRGCGLPVPIVIDIPHISCSGRQSDDEHRDIVLCVVDNAIGWMWSCGCGQIMVKWVWPYLIYILVDIKVKGQVKGRSQLPCLLI